MRTRTASRRLMVLYAALLAVLGLVVVAVTTDVGLVQRLATMVGAAAAVVAAALPLVRWVHAGRVPGAAKPERVLQAKESLAAQVRRQWRTEAQLRALDDPYPVAVRWRVTERELVMDRHVGSPAGSLTISSDDITALADEFRRMPRRRLVILGGPGIGKTTLAVQLVRELLRDRADHRSEPVPILLSVAGWDTGKYPRLHEWITARLTSDYRALSAHEFGPGAPAALAENGHILPVLDGLDELPPASQAAVINALNWSLSGDDQLIVTSRTTEYTGAVQQAGTALAGALVIEADPLDHAVAADYLGQSLPLVERPLWEPILAVLRGTDPPTEATAALTEITETPWGLWLLRVAYCTTYGDPAPLLDTERFPDAESLRAHLFDLLIPALIRTREPSDEPGEMFRPRRRHDPKQVRETLGFLAHRMAVQPAEHSACGGRDLAWWQIARMAGAFTPITRCVLGALVVLLCALGFLVQSFVGFLMFGVAEYRLTFWSGLVTGLPLGIMVAVTAKFWARDEPGFADLRHLGRVGSLARSLVRWLPFGIAVGLIIGLDWLMADVLLGFEFNVVRDLFWAVVLLGLPIGLAVGVLALSAVPTHSTHENTPMAGWRADRTLNLIRIFAPALAVMAAFTIYGVVDLIVGLSEGGVKGVEKVGLFFFCQLLTGCAFGFAFGLAVLLTVGRHRAWVAYVVTTHRLARTRGLPRRLMLFLDDAHQLGLLRAVGEFYQFRHSEFQDHLAATYGYRNP